MVKRVYFGHPINTYGTELENYLLDKIFLAGFFNGIFEGWTVENPNQKHHQENCQTWKEKTGNAMNYFYECVLPECHAGIFLPFCDGKWGAGVFGEADWLVKHDCPIWEINHYGRIRKIECFQEIPFLNVEETRKRIRDANGQMLPY